jgi:hypothetical protein
VLLLHGPLQSDGINEVTQYLVTDPRDRPAAWEPFHAGHTVQAMSIAFRRAGFRIVYSGWVEDADWLQRHANLFDALVLSEQRHIPHEAEFGGTRIPNNKEKIYLASARGLAEVERRFGGTARVLRCRSDVCIDPVIVSREFGKLIPGSRRFLVEYFNGHKMFALPDFMLGGECAVLRLLYDELYARSAAGRADHMSSHVDHSLGCIRLFQAGRAGEMVAMGRLAFDSVTWRGVPRHLSRGVDDAAQHRMFDCVLQAPPGLDVEGIVGAVPAALTDRSRVAPREAATA